MERFTEKNKDGSIRISDGINSHNFCDERLVLDRAIKKLSQSEDIEEELGVSLLLYYTMCVKGCELYCKPDINVVQYYHKYIYHAELKCFCLMIFSALTPMYYVKDYRKTWALTKEELENKGE